MFRPYYHLVSRLHFSIDDEVDDVVVLRSAPGAALPQNGLVRLFISAINNIILRLAPQAVIPISHRSFSVRDGNVAMSTS